MSEPHSAQLYEKNVIERAHWEFDGKIENLIMISISTVQQAFFPHKWSSNTPLNAVNAKPSFREKPKPLCRCVAHALSLPCFSIMPV